MSPRTKYKLKLEGGIRLVERALESEETVVEKTSVPELEAREIIEKLETAKLL